MQTGSRLLIELQVTRPPIRREKSFRLKVKTLQEAHMDSSEDEEEEEEDEEGLIQSVSAVAERSSFQQSLVER